MSLSVHQSLQTEADMAWLYGRMAEHEPDEEVAAVLRSLAEAEREHLAHLAASMGVEAVAIRPGWRARILAWIAVRFGARMVLPLLSELEGAIARATRHGRLARESIHHKETLRALSARGGSSGNALATLEGRHHAMGGNALRAAVLGANDGLVSNLCLVMGVAGATTGSSAVLVAGAAGLLAGAISMALGEWLSVQSSRELHMRQIEIERQELAASPEDEARELALLYQAKGLPPENARALAETMMANRASALDTLVREELGIDPEELGGSPWTAAATSFALFAVSALVPLLPFFWLEGHRAILVAGVISGATLFLMGTAISVLTGRNAVYSGARQMLFGLVAAALTFGIGRVVGSALLH